LLYFLSNALIIEMGVSDLALEEQAVIEPLSNRQVADVGTNPETPSLNSSRQRPVSESVLQAAAYHGPSLLFQSKALAHLIDDLLMAETSPEVAEANSLAEPRLPGENANDTLRYLLHGLRRELNRFNKDLRGVATFGAVAARRLDRLQQFAMGVVGALRNVPSSGAGDAMSSLIGSFLDQAGLLPWDEFLSLYPAARAEAPARPEAGRDEARLQRMLSEPVEGTKRAFVESAPIAVEDDRIGSATWPSADAADTFRHPAECEAEDPLEIPLILVRPVQGDWARVLVKKGLGYLTKCYGEPAESLKPLLKTWLAQSGDDHKKVFKLIAEAQARNEPDPKSWVGRHLAQQAPAWSR
jgi:hypothetical protein